jgi:hypothetical protein
MGDSAPSINITGDALEWAEQKFRKLLGKDYESQELAEWFRGLQQSAITQTASVHCLGMRSPLPFDSVYQPNRLIVAPEPGEAAPAESFAWGDRISLSILRGRAFEQKAITVEEFLLRDQDALIFGGPGWGKTTFLHHIFRSTVKRDDLLPVLISLRRPTAVVDLERYVTASSRIQKKQHRACTLLLVDGYDEINTEQRKRVSEALLQFQSRGAGKFYLTCRDYYQVSQLSAPEVRLDAFTREDQVRFVRVFLSAFSTIRQDAEVVISQLEEHGFREFLSHPLLLTLACIVRTTSSTAQPRSGLRLLDKALEVLCLSWDEQKNIDRQRTTPLDGSDRVRILRNIAYRAASPFVKRQRAEQIARKQLCLLGWDRVEPRDALIEIARFYGILVPAEDGYEFVHRTIHDFTQISNQRPISQKAAREFSEDIRRKFSNLGSALAEGFRNTLGSSGAINCRTPGKDAPALPRSAPTSVALRMNMPYAKAIAAYRKVRSAFRDETTMTALFSASCVREHGLVDLNLLYERWCTVQVVRVILSLGFEPDNEDALSLVARALVTRRDLRTEDENLTFMRGAVSLSVQMEPGMETVIGRGTKYPDLVIKLNGGAQTETVVLDVKCHEFAESKGVPRGTTLPSSSDEIRKMYFGPDRGGERNYSMGGKNRAFLLHPCHGGIPEPSGFQHWSANSFYGERYAYDWQNNEAGPDHHYGAVYLRPGELDDLRRLLGMVFNMATLPQLKGEVEAEFRCATRCLQCGGNLDWKENSTDKGIPKYECTCGSCGEFYVFTHCLLCSRRLVKCGMYWSYHSLAGQIGNVRCPRCGTSLASTERFKSGNGFPGDGGDPRWEESDPDEYFGDDEFIPF